MQNLRDKLLKAGKITKKQRRKADQQSRQQRHKKRGHAQAAQMQVTREAAYEAKLQQERTQNKAHDLKRRQQKEARETRLRIMHVADFYGVSLAPGPHRWYYMKRGGRIDYLNITATDSHLFERGDLAVVLRPTTDGGSETYSVVQRKGADAIWNIDSEHIRFYNRGKDRRARFWEVADTPQERTQ